MLNNLKRVIFNPDLKNYLRESVIDSEPIMIPFGAFSLIAYPLFYLINLYLLAPQGYNNIGLRLIISCFCIALILKNFWPNKLRPYLPIVWYCMLFFSIPFFATFMALKNHFSPAWSLNALALLVLMILFVDWIPYILLLSSGLLFGTMAYFFTTPNAFPFSIDPTPLNFLDLLSTYFVSLIMGIIFSRKRRLVEDEKLKAVKSIGASIAHELRTPLASIYSCIAGAKTYLPKLIEGYTLAKNKNLPVAYIRPDHYEILSTVLNEVEHEVCSAHNIIDMLLLKVNLNTQQSYYAEYSIKHCVEEALARYSFDTIEQKNLVHCNITYDFKFHGEKLLMEHIIFNLLKNALYCIAEAKKGEILIWTKHGFKSNILYFKDTAKGMSPYVHENLFKKFFTNTRNGTGLGLSFCKTVMQKFGGEISCNTEEGEYTEFAFHFPAPSL
jgi:signal transduction histidine kinase